MDGPTVRLYLRGYDNILLNGLRMSLIAYPRCKRAFHPYDGNTLRRATIRLTAHLADFPRSRSHSILSGSQVHPGYINPLNFGRFITSYAKPVTRTRKIYIERLAKRKYCTSTRSASGIFPVNVLPGENLFALPPTSNDSSTIRVREKIRDR